MSEDKKNMDARDIYHPPIRKRTQPLPGEEIVISGIAGAFPQSENVHQFMENLFNKVDMIQGSRWDMKHPNIPPHCGLIPDMSNFDIGYFGWHMNSETMEPAVRQLMEKVIEALFDAGLNPSELENTRTGIFNAACFNDNDCAIAWGITNIDTILNSGKSPAFDRLSHHLKIQGRTSVLDTACSSSLYAMEHAFRAIKSGEVETAIVTGTNLLRHPYITLQFSRLGVLSPDCCCKVFDESGDGYVRSESIGALVLQKKRDAKRLYVEVINCKTNCDGFKEDGITFPSGKMQTELLKEFYQECEIDPHLLSYMEAHGTGTRVGDPEETEAIDNVFAKGRKDNLLIGSVKSNVGHSEPSSGICSVVKSIIAMETGFIPPNIHFNRPRPVIKGIIEGRMSVVTEKTPFKDDRGLIGVNSFGFGGANCHVLLKKNFKKNDANIDDLPRLVCISGRNREAVDCLLDSITLNSDHIGLIHNIFRRNVPNHKHRGFAILDESGEIERFTESYFTYPKPIYIIFGELNDTFEISRQFMQVDTFVKTFQKIEEHLSSSGVKMSLLNPSENLKRSIVYKLAVQVAIADTLKPLKIKTNDAYGFSYGILAAAYFNEMITLAEVFNCAVVFQNNLSKNSEKMKNGHLLAALSLVFPEKSSLPSYFCDSVFNKSDFHCNVFKIDSVVLKIGNVSLLDVNEDVVIQSIFTRTTQNQFKDFLNTLGKIYCKGQNLQIHELYPKVTFPVGRGTKMISPYIKWNRDRPIFTLNFQKHAAQTVSVKTSKISNSGDWSFVTGHIIDGRNLFPATGYLYLVWELFSEQCDIEMDNMSITFEDCRFLRATTVPSEGELKLQASILPEGNFEILEGDSPIVTGKIKIDFSRTERKLKSMSTNSFELKSKDIYKELRLRGYNYSKGFKGMQQCDLNASEGLIKWEDNWITFMDNMLQMKILKNDTRSLFVPTHISKLSIDVKKHKEWIADNYSEEDQILLPIFADPTSDVISCGYITISGLLATPIAKKKDIGIPVLEKYQFVPNSADLELTESVRVNCQIILENTLQYDIKCIELIDEWTVRNGIPLSLTIKEVFEDQPLVKPTITIFSNMDLDVSIPVESDNLGNASDCTLIIASNLLKRKEILDQAIKSLQENGYIISRESLDSSLIDVNDPRVTVVTNYQNRLERIFMLKKNNKSSEPFVIKISDEANFDWIDEVKDVVQSKKQKNVILYAEEEPTNGIIGLVNCLRREPESSYVRCFFIIDKIDGFKPKAPFFKQQLDKNLAINVFKDGSWGTYRHLLLNQSITTESEHFEINSLVPGDMSSLRWVKGSLPTSPISTLDKIPVQVHYSTLNFKDVMVASGKLNRSVICSDRLMEEDLLGFEYSGIDINGRKVAGINLPALSTMIMADKFFTLIVPDSMTLEEAATIPAVYATVLYGFVMRAHIKRGCSILIHSATGGVGQAAITIAQHYGCEIFVTLGTAEKKQFLKENFPKIKDSHIGNSRDTSFEQMIYKQTHGRGVDIVLNSLSEDKLLASVRCLAKGGKFLEIGKFDLSINNDLSLLLMKKTASYHGIMFDKYFNETADKKTEVMKLVQDGIRDSIIKPLNRTVFDYNDVEQAFRYMTTGKHMGKVLVKVKPNETDSTKKSTCFTRYRCDADKTYVILGGLGGFGLELADWLILRGARKLVLTSRKGVTNGYQKLRLKTWSSYGVLVQISQVDIFTREGCEELLRESEQLGPVHAIFNLAVVLADAIFENQTIESFKISFAPKAVATKHLDEASRILCPSLRDFVIFSSVSCGRGNSGQTNYGMANSVMERICELRRKEGFPAVAIEWGAIGDVGLVAEMQEDHKILEIGGTLTQKITNCLNVLDVLLTQRESAIVSSMVVAEKRTGGSGAVNAVEAVTNLIGINDLTSVSHHSTLAELGMDSMMAVEIKQILERDFGTFLTAKEIKALTVSRLKEIDDNLNKPDESPDDAKVSGYGYSFSGEITEGFTADITLTKLPTAVLKNTSTTNIAFIFPGIDGNPVLLKYFAKELKADSIYSVEYRSEIDGPSVDDLVTLAMPLIKEKINNKFFKFVAHSFGGIVALEMAKKLESEGYSGKIFLIDTSPSMLKKLIAFNQLKFGTDLETSVLCEIFQIFYPPEEVDTLKDTLKNCREDKLNAFAELICQKSTLKADFFQQITKGLIQKTEFMESYQPSFVKIGCPLTLARASEMEIIDDRHDYGLSDLAQLPVEVHVIESNHSSILESRETIQILNDWICRNDN